MAYDETQAEVETILTRWNRVTTILPEFLARKYIVTDIDWAKQQHETRISIHQEFEEIRGEMTDALGSIASECKQILEHGISEKEDLAQLEADLDTALDSLRQGDELNWYYLLSEEQNELTSLQKQLRYHSQVAEHTLRFARARHAQFERATELASKLENYEQELEKSVKEVEPIEFPVEELKDIKADIEQIQTEIDRYERTVEQGIPAEAKEFLDIDTGATSESFIDYLNFDEQPSVGRLREWRQDIENNIRRYQCKFHLAHADAALVDATEAFASAYQEIEQVAPDRKAINNALNNADIQLERAEEAAPEGGRIHRGIEDVWSNYQQILSSVEATERFAEHLRLCDKAIASFDNAYAEHLDEGVPNEHLPQSTIDSLRDKLHQGEDHVNDAVEEIPTSTSSIIAYEDVLQIRHEQINASHEDLNDHNKNYATELAGRYPEVFTDVNGYQLNERQREAVIASEDRILVSAPAGTGKTKTINHRVKYLVNVKGEPVETILATGFAKATVNELEERINAPGIRCLTIDKLAKDITQGIEPGYQIPGDLDSNDSPTQIIAKQLFETKTDPNSQYFDQEFTRNLVRLKRHWTPAYNREPPEKIEDTTPESSSLDKLTHYLEIHGIDPSRNEPIRKVEGMLGEGEYVADLLLEEFGIVISHLPLTSSPYDNAQSDIDPLDAVRKLSRQEESAIDSSAGISLEEIKTRVEWEKQRFSELDEYDVVFTYEWENQNGTLTEHLESRLIEHLVIPVPINEEEFIKRHSDDDQETSSIDGEIKDKVAAAIEMARTRGVPTTKDRPEIENEQQVVVTDGSGAKTIQELYPSGSPLYSSFGDVLASVYDDFDEFREHRGYLDFVEMKNRAADHLKTNTEHRLLNQYEFDYIIIDEFQDISPPDMHFLDALAQANDAQLFCVGDDWQSIYGFRGTTPTFFINFETHYDLETNVITLNQTYRNPQSIVDASTRLISNNSNQRTKDLSAATEKRGSVTVHKERSRLIKVKTAELVEDYLDDSDSVNDSDTEAGDIMIIGRVTKKLHEVVSELYDRNIPVKLKYETGGDPDSDKVVVTTAHGAKGASAQHVIVHNAIDNEYGGFPDMREGSLTSPVEPEGSNTIESERRLFYVALTRSKQTVDIVTTTKKKEQSRFIREFRPDFQEHQTDEAAPQLSRAELNRIRNHGIWDASHRVLRATPFDGYTAQSLLQHAYSETETGIPLFQYVVELIDSAQKELDTKLSKQQAIEFYYWYTAEADSYFSGSDEEPPNATVGNALTPFKKPIQTYNEALETGLQRIFKQNQTATLLDLVEVISESPLLNTPTKPPEFEQVINTYASGLNLEEYPVETVADALDMVASSLVEDVEETSPFQIQDCVNYIHKLQNNLPGLGVPYPLHNAADLRWRLPELEDVGILILDDRELLTLRELKRWSREPQFEVIAAATKGD